MLVRGYSRVVGIYMDIYIGNDQSDFVLIEFPFFFSSFFDRNNKENYYLSICYNFERGPRSKMISLSFTSVHF